MPNDVELRLNSRAACAEVEAAIQRLLGRLATETAQGAEAGAPKRSGFLASTAGATRPGEDGRPASVMPIAGAIRQAAATPAAGRHDAYAYVAALYALFVELKTPYLLPAAQAVLARIEGILAQEGV